MTKNQVQHLAHLQLQLCSSDERLAFLEETIRQLAIDNCSIDISFFMHNEDQHQRNESQKTVQGMSTMQGLMSYINDNDFPPASKKEPACSTNIRTKYSESQAMRITSLMHSIEKEKNQELKNQIEQIFHQHFKTVVQKHLSDEYVNHPVLAAWVNK